MSPPGVTHPKNDVLFVRLKPPPTNKNEPQNDWYARLPYSQAERDMPIADYVSAYIAKINGP